MYILMTRMDATAARAGFSELTNRVAYGKERVLIQRKGKSIAALISVDDLELLERLEDELDLRAARKALKGRGAKPWDKFKAERGL
jgi:prevent-host-death family protein